MELPLDLSRFVKRATILSQHKTITMNFYSSTLYIKDLRYLINSREWEHVAVENECGPCTDRDSVESET